VKFLEQFIDLETQHKFFFYFVFAVVVMGMAVLATRVIRGLVDRYFRKTSLSSKVDPTRYTFAKNGVSFVIFLIATIIIFYTIPSLRALGLTLFASAGILAAIIGFASQAAFSNIISGIFIVIFKPFRVDDIVTIGTNMQGIVEDITLRHTVIKNFENRRIVIPNSVISNEVIINSTITEERVCIFLEMGISYSADLDVAMAIMADEANKHPKCIDVRNQEEIAVGEPKVKTRVIGFGDSSVNLRAWVWANSSPEGFEMKCDLFRSIKLRFDKEGIEIPYPHRTVVYKNGGESHGSQAE
jgi:small-conductance mechanosensitive channel